MPLIRTLSDITTTLESANDAHDRIRHVLELLRDIVPYDQCALLELQVGAEDRLSLLPEPPPPAREALANTLRLLIGRVAEETQPSRRVGPPEPIAATTWSSHMAVPLVGLDQVVGLLFVGRRDADAYGEHDLSLLSLVAAQLAAYVTAVREQTGRIIAETTAGRLRELQAVTDAAVAHLGLEELMREVLGQILEMLKADSVAILLSSEDETYLVERASIGLPPHLEGLQIPLTDDVTRQAAGFEQPGVNGLAGLQAASTPFRETFPSMLGASLLANGRWLGILLVGAFEPNRFAEADVQLLQLACGRIALPLDHAHVHARELRIRAYAETVQHRLALLTEVTTLLTASLDYEGALQSVARLVVPSLADLCIVDLAENDGVIHQMALAHAAPAFENQVREARAQHPVELNSAHPVAQVVRTARPAVYDTIPAPLIESTLGGSTRGTIDGAQDLKSAMVIPLAARGRALGAITYVSVAAARYGATEVALAEQIASRIALAVDNGRLYREARLAEARYQQLFWRGALNDSLRTSLRTPANTLESALERAPASSGPESFGSQLFSQPAPFSVLTVRERDVLEALVAGASTREIAKQLSVSENAVRYHLKNLFQKLQVQNRAQLVAYSLRLGLIR